MVCVNWNKGALHGAMQQAAELQISSERIRQLVEREGKTARNLVTWSVPAINQHRPRERLQAPGPGRGKGWRRKGRGGKWSKEKLSAHNHRDSDPHVRRLVGRIASTEG